MSTGPDRWAENDDPIEQYESSLSRASFADRPAIRRRYRELHPGYAEEFDRVDQLRAGAAIDPGEACARIDLLGGRYTYLGLLGAGGMGFVCRVSDTVDLGREVALKMIRPREGPSGGEVRERFLREIRAMGRVVHDNVIAIRDSGEVDGHLYFTMPLLDGSTLKEHLAGRRQRKTLPPAAVAWLGEEVARGLEALHDTKLLHRDIKPSNIGLVRDDGGPPRGVWPYRPVVMDLGLVRAASSPGGPLAGEASLTAKGEPVGTPTYMAPEQFVGKAEERSDLFSLGCVLYEAATGELPYGGASSFVEAALRFRRPLVSPREHNAAIPVELSRYIARLLEPEAGRRPGTAGEVAKDLRRIRRWMGPIGLLRRAISAPLRATSSARRLATPVGFRRPVRGAAIGVTGASILLSASYALWRLDTEPIRAWLQESGKSVTERLDRIVSPPPPPPPPPNPEPAALFVSRCARSGPAQGLLSNQEFAISLDIQNTGGAMAGKFDFIVHAMEVRGSKLIPAGEYGPEIGEKRTQSLPAGASATIDIPCLAPRRTGDYIITTKYSGESSINYLYETMMIFNLTVSE